MSDTHTLTHTHSGQMPTCWPHVAEGSSCRGAAVAPEGRTTEIRSSCLLHFYDNTPMCLPTTLRLVHMQLFWTLLLCSAAGHNQLECHQKEQDSAHVKHIEHAHGLNAGSKQRGVQTWPSLQHVLPSFLPSRQYENVLRLFYFGNGTGGFPFYNRGPQRKTLK